MQPTAALSPECPECGGQYCKQRQTGADTYGTKIRERICRDCNHKFITAEVVIQGAKFSQLDVERKAYQKEWRRQRFGWWGQRTYQRPSPFLLRIATTVFNPNLNDGRAVGQTITGQDVTARGTLPEAEQVA